MNMNITENYFELTEIESIEYTDEYINMIDISVDVDESFCLSNGIVSHNSAAGTIVAGLSELGRDYYGLMSLKGKPLNIRNSTLSHMKDNEEMKNIMNAIGLEIGKTYTDTKDLRYGRIIIMTDADCIEENSLIITKRGNVCIKDITYEDEVLTHTNNWKQVVNILQKDVTEYICLVINNRKFNFGLYHKIPILRNNEVLTVLVKDINYDDLILVKDNNENLNTSKIDNIIVIKDNKTFYDIGVEDDHTFYIVNDNFSILSSNCDGYHIAGLILNFIEFYWSSLLKIQPPFLSSFITPIMSATKNDKSKYFYKISDYIKWKETNNVNNYFIKYYKGLGSILPSEAKLFFKNIDKHLIEFNYDKPDITEDLIDMLFAKKRADERKDWLTTYKLNNIIEKFSRKTTFENFFSDEFIEYSMMDNLRSLPSIVDSLKISQRKVIYTMLKKNMTSEIKVSQLTGNIIDLSAYHNGSVSLETTIVGLAQNFVGSNNLNLLEPKGNFGSRLAGGFDSASPRYIFTKLNNITRNIFLKEDDNILEYKQDDNQSIEPLMYYPIVPLILVNGAKGIGTGYSSDISQFNIQDIIKWLYLKLNNKKTKVEIEPYYRYFKGDIIKIDDKKYITRGIIKKVNTSTLKILELPIGVWTNNYYEILDKLIDNKVIKDYKKNSTDVDVDIDVSLSREKLIELEENDLLYKIFELESSISLNNMMAFDENNKLKKYESQYQILEEFYNFRLIKYQDRKDYLIQNKNKEINVLENRIKFITLINDKKIIINNKSKEEIIINLEKYKFDKIDDSYSYLLDMRIYNLSKEKIDDLNTELLKEQEILKSISDITIQQMWINDLQVLKKSL